MGANTSKHQQTLKTSASSSTTTLKRTTNNRLPPQKLEDLVDLGTVFPNGLYTATEQDYDARIVRKLIIQRKIAPFYKGLPDAPEPVTPTITTTAADTNNIASLETATSSTGTSNTNDIHSGNDNNSNIPTPSTTITVSSTPDITKLIPKPVPQRSASSSSLLEVSAARTKNTYNNKPLPGRPRSQSHSKVNDVSYDPYAERKKAFVEKMKQREKMLYNDAVECPICFLYYPANINYSRCCDQPICTECFVQIHRPLDAPSQPATCPYCMEENYGIIYEPPAWSEKNPQQHGRARSSSHSSMSGTRHTTSGIGETNIPRRASVDYKDPDVVLVDHIRPNWNKALASKVQSGRTTVSRRNSVSAANTSLTSSLAATSSTNNNNNRSTNNRSRHNNFFSRSSSSNSNSNSSGNNGGTTRGALSSLFVTRPGRSASSAAAAEYNQYLSNMRVSNMDLEDWMVMEAIRLSLAEQEERERKEALEKRKKEEQEQQQGSSLSNEAECSDSQADNSEETISHDKCQQKMNDTQTQGEDLCNQNLDTTLMAAVITSHSTNLSSAASPSISSSSSSSESISSAASSTKKQSTTTSSASTTTVAPFTI
ncbi:hypothetical protein BDF20DRAFT_882906 [Mycotypha africana]|uniref:uncharacterized protein n=1 Tax=Mycotypha africana TaxID=64632 RepID=UPI0023008956|nr:uncharacterized protein BDF20DRAFT_882906 [Mycotypha africana]KAI8973535.1 hypothetical protein BDF20DRAFT_882906 [Mycotypha africana]